jgi:ABC-2 type transport system ATP-binding protein
VAEKICDRISIINNGQIIAQGTMTELRAKAGREESLEKIFLEVTQ